RPARAPPRMDRLCAAGRFASRTSRPGDSWRFPDKNIAPLQIELRELVENDDPDEPPVVRDFPNFAKAFLHWRGSDLAGGTEGPPLPDALAAHLVEYGETLTPTFAVPAPAAGDGSAAWQMLIQAEPVDTDLDANVDDDGRRWVATPHARFERVLRE